MFQIILDERKRREIDPTLVVLRDCAAELAHARPAQPYARARVEEMQRFMEAMSGLYEETRKLPAGALRQLARLRGRVRRLLGGES